jgi:hypothetical protein
MKQTRICRSLIFGLTLGLFSGAAFAQAVGDRVTALWEADGLWYPGEIEFIDRQGIHVSFDDGDEAIVARNEVRRLNWRVGTRLECNWKNEGDYYPGRINAMRGESIDFVYDDGGREQLTVSRCRSN